MEFNSLDAQREAAEAYIKSQQHEGWVLMPEHYDDGGFSGGTMDRPAITRHKKIQPLYHRLEAVTGMAASDVSATLADALQNAGLSPKQRPRLLSDNGPCL